LQAKRLYGIVAFGKGGEGPGTERLTRDLNSTLPEQVHQTPRIESHGEEEKGKEEIEVNDRSVSLVLGPRSHLRISRDLQSRKAAGPRFGRFRFWRGKIQRLDQRLDQA